MTHAGLSYVNLGSRVVDHNKGTYLDISIWKIINFGRELTLSML